jgi:putative endonuclease
VADARRAVGRAGEVAVARWYVEQGYALLDRNWRVRDGEIDVIVRRRDTIAFCEVKTRRSTAFGAPAEAVTPRKQQRLRSLARQWLLASEAPVADLRFDVAAVTPDGRGGWLVDVFEAAF